MRAAARTKDGQYIEGYHIGAQLEVWDTELFDKGRQGLPRLENVGRLIGYLLQLYPDQTKHEQFFDSFLKGLESTRSTGT